MPRSFWGTKSVSDGLPLDIYEFNRPYWEALTRGSLIFQSCMSCGHCWMPASRSCPACLSMTWSWRESCGKGKIISWVVYHKAYHPAFKNRLPYNVAIIELLEGPRMISNVLGDCTTLAANAAVNLTVELEGDIHVPRFSFEPCHRPSA
ncbi:DNA-binding protein [Candidimonas sp. SYP-B2681]|nr:DNA-binding protein [Candidimonas sp. SYP-B2681]